MSRSATMTTAPATTAPARRRSTRLPAFTLYGEEDRAERPLSERPLTERPQTGRPDTGRPVLHIESIDSRSSLYDWEIGVHVHRGLHQLLWLRAGKVEAILDESRSHCAGPAVLVIPPGVAHAFRFSRHADGYVLTLDAKAMAEGDAAGAGNALRVLFAAPQVFEVGAGSPDVARLQALFEALNVESNAGDGAGGPVPMWLARAIVWRLAQLGKRQLQAGLLAARGRQSIYTRWLVLLEAHYRDHWPVSRYAHQLGLSPERLNRIVRAETGENVQRQIHTRLAREATRLLVHVAAPVSRLAFELGFDDPAYFCRFIKRHTGMSPREYRVRMLQD